MKLLGLTGPAAAGKDYTYETLSSLYTDVHRVSLADELRFEIQAILNDGRDMNALWQKPYTDPVRWILQHYGTEYRRAQDPDYWVNKVEETIWGFHGEQIVVVTDVRFANEADLIRELGGLVVEVRADEMIRRRRIGGPLPPSHASEIIDFPVDAVIRNNDQLTIPAEVTRYLDLSRERFKV